jgi:protein transport protein SEC13
MTTPVASIDSLHTEMVHDCQFDYYSKKMATCSSDRSIKIFDVAGDIYHNSATITGFDGPVWQVAWAHPKFGSLLASCSYDGTVAVHREGAPNTWTRVYDHKFHDSSVNSISWASHEYGLVLACASSDGRVSILEYKNNQWFVVLVMHLLSILLRCCHSRRSESFFQNDTLGCNAVSWAPYSPAASHSEDGSFIFRLVTGSCDNVVRVWKKLENSPAGWVEEARTCATPHSDWVRDVAWAPSSSLPYSMFASCSEDRSVYIWRQTEHGWEPSLLHAFDAPVWRLSWSVTGNVLAVSTGDHKVTLWKQSVDESWVQISALEDAE